MKQKTGKNYYELLDVTPESTAIDIEEGYRQALKIYSGNSDAVYSLYSTKETEAMTEAIKIAYETLRDPEKRRAYDSMMMMNEEYDEETPEVDIEELTGASAFSRPPAAVENVRNTVRLKRPFFLEGADPMVVEQYRILCSRIEETSHRNNSKMFAFTSAVKGEGKSVTCLNVAYLMATEFRKKTVLVECDLRKRSTVVNNLEETDGSGLGDVLRGEKDLHNAISRVEGTSLYILPAGNAEKRAAELLGSQSLKKVMGALKDSFDYAIVDCAPVLALVDMNLVSRFVDGVVFVVRAKSTKKDFVTRAVGSLKGVDIVGTVLNGGDLKLRKYYY